MGNIPTNNFRFRHNGHNQRPLQVCIMDIELSFYDLFPHKYLFDVQVIVYEANHKLFDESSLIQISGRVGRKIKAENFTTPC